MRVTLPILASVALAACAPAIPDSGSGVGFNDYAEYQAAQAARDAQLAGSGLPAPAAVTSAPLSATGGMPAAAAAAGTPGTGSNDAADLAAETRAALAGSAANSGIPPVQADPNNPPPQTVETVGGMSSENDFQAVGAERSIQDDAALIAQNRAQYQVIQPTALPQRNGAAVPNIVDFALASSHPVGSAVYRRSGLGKDAKYNRNCAKYASSDLAQQDFLARGGPQRDKLGLDPDGDGYACAWDPSPFRKAVMAVDDA